MRYMTFLKRPVQVCRTCLSDLRNEENLTNFEDNNSKLWFDFCYAFTKTVR